MRSAVSFFCTVHVITHNFYRQSLTLQSLGLERAISTGVSVCVQAIKVPYKWSPVSVFAPEGHLHRVPVSCPLVKGLAGLKRGAVQVQTDCALCVADIFHTMQANGVWNVHAHKQKTYIKNKRLSICHRNAVKSSSQAAPGSATTSNWDQTSHRGFGEIPIQQRFGKRPEYFSLLS